MDKLTFAATRRALVSSVACTIRVCRNETMQIYGNDTTARTVYRTQKAGPSRRSGAAAIVDKKRSV